MVVLIFLQAIPVFGVGTVARLAPPIIFGGLAIMWRIFVGKLESSTLVKRGDNEVAPGARGFVNNLLQLGFQFVGSVDARGPDYATVFTYLVSSDRRTFAVATDRVETFASLFEDRILVTIDRSSMPVPPTELRQFVPADPPELYEAHKRALAAVSGQGMEPEHLASARVVDRAIEHEQRSVEFLGSRPWWVAWEITRGVIRRRPPGSETISDDPGSIERILRWQQSAQPVDE
jgi:hypothetical protein